MNCAKNILGITGKAGSLRIIFPLGPGHMVIA